MICLGGSGVKLTAVTDVIISSCESKKPLTDSAEDNILL